MKLITLICLMILLSVGVFNAQTNSMLNNSDNFSASASKNKSTKLLDENAKEPKIEVVGSGDFGRFECDVAPKFMRIGINNIGDTALTIKSIVITGKDSDCFSIFKPLNDTIIGVNGQDSIIVRFNEGFYGVLPKLARLEIKSNSELKDSTYYIELSAIRDVEEMQLTDSIADFGIVYTNTTSIREFKGKYIGNDLNLENEGINSYVGMSLSGFTFLGYSPKRVANDSIVTLRIQFDAPNNANPNYQSPTIPIPLDCGNFEIKCRATIVSSDIKINTIALSPANDVINVKYTIVESVKTELIIYDFWGKTLISKPVDTKTLGTKEESIELKNLPLGQYYLMLKTPTVNDVKIFQIGE